jgi:hypothetical protein
MYAVIKPKIQIFCKKFKVNLDLWFYYSIHAVEFSTACKLNQLESFQVAHSNETFSLIRFENVHLAYKIMGANAVNYLVSFGIKLVLKSLTSL